MKFRNTEQATQSLWTAQKKKRQNKTCLTKCCCFCAIVAGVCGGCCRIAQVFQERALPLLHLKSHSFHEGHFHSGRFLQGLRPQDRRTTGPLQGSIVRPLPEPSSSARVEEVTHEQVVAQKCERGRELQSTNKVRDALTDESRALTEWTS